MPDNLGERIRRLRKKAGLTQEQLAEAVGVNPITISWWENDKYLPQTQNVKALAKALGVSEADLLNDSQHEHKPGEWVISFKTVAHFDTEEVVDMTGNISPVCSIQAGPNGCCLVIKADWESASTKKGLEELFRLILRDFYKPIQAAGIAYGEIPDEEKSSKKRR